jgi:hypothetical protein
MHTSYSWTDDLGHTQQIAELLTQAGAPVTRILRPNSSEKDAWNSAAQNDKGNQLKNGVSVFRTATCIHSLPIGQGACTYVTSCGVPRSVGGEARRA